MQLLLFTFSGNILFSYVMPGLPALALLISYYHHKLRWPPQMFLAGHLTLALVLKRCDHACKWLG